MCVLFNEKKNHRARADSHGLSIILAKTSWESKNHIDVNIFTILGVEILVVSIQVVQSRYDAGPILYSRLPHYFGLF